MRILLCIIALTLSGVAHAQRDFSNVTIAETELGSGIYMLTGAGGNMALSIGEDGAFLVDDQFAPLSEKIMAKIAELTDQPVKFVINTHWHGDHTGGNENFGNAGAIIVAHDNVHKRMSADQFMKFFAREVKAAPAAALPAITFSEQVTLHHNNDRIRAMHVPNGHTDGDAMILFEQANVLHMGDLYFNGLYPFIDVGSGGSINGVIAAIAEGLELANADTKIIPGHGPLSDRATMQAYHDMLIEIRDKVSSLKLDGMNLDEIIAAKPGANYDEAWGGKFIKPEQLITFVYSSL